LTRLSAVIASRLSANEANPNRKTMKTLINQWKFGLCVALFILLTGWVASRLRAADEPGTPPKQAPCPWKYQTFDVPAVIIERRLNELADAGLEVVSASRYSDASGVPMVFVTVKGPKNNETAGTSASQDGMKNICVYNLRQLEAAIRSYAQEHKKAANDPVTLNDLRPYLKISAICPAGGTSPEDSYRLTDCQSVPTCIAPGGGAAHGHALP